LRRGRVDEYLPALLPEAEKAGVEGGFDLGGRARRGDEQPIAFDGNIAQARGREIFLDRVHRGEARRIAGIKLRRRYVFAEVWRAGCRLLLDQVLQSLRVLH